MSKHLIGLTLIDAPSGSSGSVVTPLVLSD